jgi:hypothetical protein
MLNTVITYDYNNQISQMLKFISLILFINVFWYGQHGKAPTQDIDEEKIFYSTDPIKNVTKALKKDNIEYLGFLSKRSLTQEDKARIAELQNIITNFGVSGIFTYFYQL